MVGKDDDEARIYCGSCGECVHVPFEGSPPIVEGWEDPFWEWLIQIGRIESTRCQYAATMTHSGVRR
jgi:hypothetical protein